jgi:ABC-2 type transport system ATP-binding protein
MVCEIVISSQEWSNNVVQANPVAIEDARGAQQGQVPGISGLGKKSESNGMVLEAHGLTKRFKQFVAVHELSFNVAAGEVLGFLGPNGAGKSTTVGMILGLIRPDGGNVTIMGQPLAQDQSLVPQHVGAIIENPAFYPYLSGRDNLKAHALAVGGVSDAKIEELLKLVHLDERAKDKFKNYSLGMKQRLGIASTLLTDPALVILDEPTNGLDPAGQREIREIIPRLADEGHSILLASHMLHEVEQVSDRVAIVRKGRLITEGNVDDLVRRGGYIEVQFDDVDLHAAMRAVRALPGVEQVSEEAGRLIVVAPDAMGAAINRSLAEIGIYARAIAPKHSSLEDLFLEMTEEQPAA